MLPNRILISLVSIFVLAACQQADILPVEPFDDILLSKAYGPKWGSAQGISAIYEIYGTNPSGLKEGQAVALDHKFAFRIKDLLKKNSSFISTEALYAVNRQEKLINGL